MGDLEVLDQALLVDASVPDLHPIDEDGDDEGIVYLVPIVEVKATDRVAKKIDLMYVGAGAVGYDQDMVGLV